MVQKFGLLGVIALLLVSAGCWDSDNDESVVLLAPAASACEGLTVAFQWRIENQRNDVIYCSDIITDKGTDPFDGNFEDIFQANQATELVVSLDPNIYDPASFEWGVRVTVCNAQGASCPCQGEMFESESRRLRTSSQAPNCP